jgi:mannose-6-phosphate isomerase
MSVIRLTTKRVEKPWGRHDLWPGFDDVPDGGTPVGEVWFEAPQGVGEDDPELLVKYLFTAERLSIQVHPDDADARAHGYSRGKSESWLVLSAEPHATVALGTRAPMTRDELRVASKDGTIVGLVDWKPAKADDFWYSPPGTIHAIGAGLVLVEIQQNVDLTYRLYDYGSDRELHLDAGVEATNPVPYVAPFVPRDIAPGRRLQIEGGKFVVERWTAPAGGTLAASHERPVWLVPLKGEGEVGGEAIAPGGVWLVDGDATITVGAGIDLLVAYPGVDANTALIA